MSKTRAWERFVWNVRHLFDDESYNPFIDEDNEEPGLKAKHRTGSEDFWHSLKNLVVGRHLRKERNGKQ